MKNTKKFLKEVYTRDLKVTPKGAINQTQRNNLKNELLDNLIEDLSKGLGVDVVRLDKGIALNIQHEQEGALPITLDIVFKNITYDIDNESQAYQEDKLLKQVNKEIREKAKRVKFQNDTNARKLNSLK